MVVVSIITSANVNPIDHDPQDFGVGLLERLLGPLESPPRCLSAQHREDDAVDGTGQDDGVRKPKHGWRIDEDMIKPSFQNFQHLLKKV